MSNDLMELALDALKDIRSMLDQHSADEISSDTLAAWIKLSFTSDKSAAAIAAIEAAQSHPVYELAKELAAIGEAAQPVGVPEMEVVFVTPSYIKAVEDAKSVRGVPEKVLRYLDDVLCHGTQNEQVVANTVKHLPAAAPSLPVDEKVHCPNCPDQGWYAIETGGCGPDGENDTRQMEQVQCEFCYTTPNSVFNANQASPAVEVELPVVRWMVQFADGSIEFWGNDPKTMGLNPDFDDLPTSVTPLGSLTDAQAAIAAQAKK